MAVNIDISGADFIKSIILEVKSLDKELKAKIKTIGDETVVKIKDVINDNKVRPQAGEPNTLEDAIEVEHFEEGWGVGDIKVLDVKAPHWAAINFGSDHLVGTEIKGQFAPGLAKPSAGANRQGRLKTGPFKIKIENPIPAMNYIEKTKNFVLTKIKNLKLRKT